MGKTKSRSHTRGARETQLVVRAPHPERDVDALVDLMTRSFPRGDSYWDRRRRWQDGYLCGSHYDWKATRTGWIGEHVVTHFGVWDYRMRIGGAAVRTGGIGAVCTHGEYRKRHMMAQTVLASIAAMRERGYGMTVLFGISDFYDKFGYRRAWNERVQTLRLQRLPTGKPDVTPRSIRAADMDETEALYNAYHCNLTGAAVRPTFDRTTGRKPMPGVCWRRGGKMAGYVFYDVQERSLDIREVAGDSETLLRVIAQLARREGRRDVRLEWLHGRCDFVRFLRRGYLHEEIHYARAGGAMVRTVNLPLTLQRIRGELGKRLRRSPMRDYRGELLVQDATDKALLAIDRGKVQVVEPRASKHAIRAGHEMGQLLIGTHEPQDTIEAAGMRLTGDAKLLAPVLFPYQEPNLLPRDRF